MSSTLTQDVRCACGEEFEANLWSSLNAKEAPALKEELLSGQLNVVPCPRCKSFVYAERFFLYHDPDAELMVFVYPADHAAAADRWREKTKDDYAAAQSALPPEERFPYAPFPLFGMDQLVELLQKEENRNDEAHIAEALAPTLGIEIRRLKPAAARAQDLPPVLPLSGAGSVGDRLRQGAARLVEANDRLAAYAALRDRLSKNDAALARFLETV